MSKIEWTDETWNPITGCTPISEGCKNCYAKRMAETRLRGRFGYPQDEPFRAGIVHEDKIREPCRWREPRRVFVCSMGDILHDRVPEKALGEVMGMMRYCRHHTFMLLTKRPENARKWGRFLTPNIWLGVTAENQRRADERIPILLDIPAAVHFVSVEPMLERVVIRKPWRGLLDWVIAGPETGPGKRHCEWEWLRDLQGYCASDNVPFFAKKINEAKGVTRRQWPA